VFGDRPDQPPVSQTLVENAIVLDEIAAAVRAQYPLVSGSCGEPSDRQKLKTLCKVIVGLGFKGNVANYYEANNSMLSEVLRRKLGIPITLAVVVIAVGRRIGLTLAPVNFPRHFLLKHVGNGSRGGGGAEETFIDAFEGILKSRAEIAAMCVSTEV
jgi:regulator of sirC expression with transglutaminase-like and TPR domain